MKFRALFFGLLWMLAPWALAAQLDGPYVLRNSAGAYEAWTVEATPQGTRRHVVPLAVGEKFTVPAVGVIPAFQVRLRPPATTSPDVVRTPRGAPLFVVADTHGEYEVLASMLIAQHIVDDRLRWRFGHGHLVVLGDVFDRGANQVEILWLLYELEAQARDAGGALHFVLGNHEFMAMGDDTRYLNDKYRQSTAILGVQTYSELFDSRSALGQWLRAQPALLDIDGLLCLHGGISPEIVDSGLTLDGINERLRDILELRPPANPQDLNLARLLLGETGPLWYRGYFPDGDRAAAASDADVQRVLQKFGVSAVLVGHTRVPTITPLYGGRVIAVHVYPRRTDDGRVLFEGLLVRGGAMYRARPDGTTEALSH
jgi:diadenosine tetraphosphatase ApaH/serine/threonine PP2A family protein phosphatase